VRAASVTLCALAALTVAACGGESDGTFDHEDFPFTFSYPGDFEETDDVEASQSVGASAEASTGIGLTENDGILVSSYQLGVEVTERNIERAQREFDGLVRQLDPEAGPSEITEIAGLPSLTYDDVAVSSVEGGVSDLTFIFEGDQEYLINCQSTPDHRDEIAEACDQALESLSFE
jgi:hypothetical protein